MPRNPSLIQNATYNCKAVEFYTFYKCSFLHVNCSSSCSWRNIRAGLYILLFYAVTNPSVWDFVFIMKEYMYFSELFILFLTIREKKVPSLSSMNYEHNCSRLNM